MAFAFLSVIPQGSASAVVAAVVAALAVAFALLFVIP